MLLRKLLDKPDFRSFDRMMRKLLTVPKQLKEGR
jgi:hypothetical protein